MENKTSGVEGDRHEFRRASKEDEKLKPPN
jgi:hypothetical protein